MKILTKSVLLTLLGFTCLFYGAYSMWAWQYTFEESNILLFLFGGLISMSIMFVGFFYFALQGAFFLKEGLKENKEIGG